MSTSHRACIAALTFACLLLGCRTVDPARMRALGDILRLHANHLERPERNEIVRALIHAERRTGVDALLLLAVAEKESRFDASAKSRRGAMGLLQIRPSTGRDVCRRHRIPWRGESSLLEPSFNALIGATYLAELRERFGSWDLALTAYNRGPSAARRLAARGRKPSSRYAARVLRRLESLGETAKPR